MLMRRSCVKLLVFGSFILPSCVQFHPAAARDDNYSFAGEIASQLSAQCTAKPFSASSSKGANTVEDIFEFFPPPTSQCLAPAQFHGLAARASTRWCASHGYTDIQIKGAGRQFDFVARKGLNRIIARGTAYADRDKTMIQLVVTRSRI
jgi:hypothetical protein